jgi:hypothetical protein
MDYETLVNCFIGVFTHFKDESRTRVFVIHGERNDLPEFIEFLEQCVATNQWHISYNGLEFDAQISQYILLNSKRLKKLSTDNLLNDLYGFAQKVIHSREETGFAPFRPTQLKINQIDLFKLNHWDNKAKMSSLKWIQYSMDWDNVEEMPHPHDQPVNDDQTLQSVIEYCINDVLSTKRIFEHSKEQILLRQQLTKEYKLNLYSASEPRISKELFLHFLEQKTGIPKSEIKMGRTQRRYIVLADCILPYVEFKTPEFKAVHEYFLKTVITSTKDKLKYTMKYKGVSTDYGLGGLHGAAPEGVYEASPGWTIVTSDVTSFYPNLSIVNEFAPEHLPKKEFCDLYRWIFEERKKIPKSNPKNYVFKIILNSTYGLTGDDTSFLYDPKMTMQITINGQLLLSMLYEMICEEIPGATPLMQNTDGLETMLPTAEVGKYMEICARWERLTGLSLEHDNYSKMIIRDVNNYIAVSTSGKVKCKGAFEWEDLDNKKVSVLHKNKSFLIIPKAIHAYFVHGIKPDEFLKKNRNILDYCAGVKRKGGWWFEKRSIEEGYLKTDRLQKIVRYYISKSGSKIVKCHADGREIQVQSGPWLQTELNKIDKTVSFETCEVNEQYYLEEIQKQITQIEKVRPKTLKQLSLF